MKLFLERLTRVMISSGFSCQVFPVMLLLILRSSLQIRSIVIVALYRAEKGLTKFVRRGAAHTYSLILIGSRLPTQMVDLGMQAGSLAAEQSLRCTSFPCLPQFDADHQAIAGSVDEQEGGCSTMTLG